MIPPRSTANLWLVDDSGKRSASKSGVTWKKGFNKIVEIASPTEIQSGSQGELDWRNENKPNSLVVASRTEQAVDRNGGA
jgi:hypothetical protein